MNEMLARLLQSGIGKILIPVLAIAIVYGAFNLFIVGGQNIWHYSDQKKLDAITIQLDAELPSLKRMESDISAKEADISRVKARMESLKSDIDRVEMRYSDTVPSSEFARYNRNIDDYNDLVSDYNVTLGAYQQLFDEYERKIADYNLKVKEANALAEKIGSTWYVVPIPGGKPK